MDDREKMIEKVGEWLDRKDFRRQLNSADTYMDRLRESARSLLSLETDECRLAVVRKEG